MTKSNKQMSMRTAPPNKTSPVIAEPYRIKVIEPLMQVSRAQRKAAIKKAGYNTFLVPARHVSIDLISDSGTGAMSSQQWASMLESREDFSGQSTSEEFIRTARRLTGMRYIQPVHQGRSAENLLFGILLRKGDVVLSNTHFETTHENIETLNCLAIDIPSCRPPYCGNIDLQKVLHLMKVRKGVRAIIMTLTNNIKGGQPVSIANIKAVSQIAKKYGILLIFDASRFADNAFLNKEYDHLRGSVRHISRHIFNFCDIVYLSSKKDGLVNIGGFIGMRDQTLYKVLQTKIIQQESYPSSGGLAARDIAAMNLGLSEATNEDFLKSHIGHLRYLARLLKKNSVAVFEPVGGHGIVIFPRQNFKYAAYSLGAVLFVEAGIRGGVFNDEFRLALPRRVYTKSHLEYVANALCRIYLMILPRLTLVNKPQHFFNFFARFKPVSW